MPKSDMSVLNKIQITEFYQCENIHEVSAATTLC